MPMSPKAINADASPSINKIVKYWLSGALYKCIGVHPPLANRLHRRAAIESATKIDGDSLRCEGSSHGNEHDSSDASRFDGP